MRTVTFEYTTPQAEFHNLTCQFPLFVGGYGSGKTETLLNEAIIDVMTAPGVKVAIYAPTYDLAEMMIIPRLEEKLHDLKLRYVRNKKHNTITLKSKKYGMFFIRTLDKPERIVGYETYSSHIDELGLLTYDKAKLAFDKICGRNRQIPRGMSKDKVLNKVSTYGTPEGFTFLYENWGKSDNPDYGMVKASTYSNEKNLPNGYITALKSRYDEQLIEAYIDGGFVNLTGKQIYRNYNRIAHRSTETIRDNEQLFIGCDFNVTKQAATIYVKRRGGSEWHAVDELKDMYDTPEMITIIKERWPGHKIIMYPDATGKSRKTVNASTSDLALLEQAGFWVRANPSNPLVKDRILAMNTALKNGKIFVNTDKCETVAACLEKQIYNKNGSPDKDSGVDHQNDASTYPIAFEMPIHKPIAHIKVAYPR